MQHTRLTAHGMARADTIRDAIKATEAELGIVGYGRERQQVLDRLWTLKHALSGSEACARRLIRKDDMRIVLNDSGRRIGESHHNAILTDYDVRLVLELISVGVSYAVIAEKFGVSKSCIAHISSGRRRGQWTARVIAE